MPSVTVYADVQTQGYLKGDDNYSCTPGGRSPGSYGTARNNCDEVVTSDLRVGQRKYTEYCSEASSNYDRYDVFMTTAKFDISSAGIPAGSIITVATLKIYGKTDLSTTDFVLRAYTSTTEIVADGCGAWDSTPNGTYIASINTSGYSTSALNSLTSESAFPGEVSAALGGTLNIVFISQETTSNSAPTNNEYVTFENPTSTAATDPQIDITYVDPNGMLFGVNF